MPEEMSSRLCNTPTTLPFPAASFFSDPTSVTRAAVPRPPRRRIWRGKCRTELGNIAPPFPLRLSHLFPFTPPLPFRSPFSLLRQTPPLPLASRVSHPRSLFPPARPCPSRHSGDCRDTNLVPGVHTSGVSGEPPHDQPGENAALNNMMKNIISLAVPPHILHHMKGRPNDPSSTKDLPTGKEPDSVPSCKHRFQSYG